MNFTVQIQPAGFTFQVSADETILEAALRQGIDFPHRCRQGVCTSCVCRLQQGSVHYEPPEPLSSIDKAQNFTYGCLAYPRTDLVLHHPFIRA